MASELPTEQEQAVTAQERPAVSMTPFNPVENG